ncbi:MAG TPA: hypothetical protein VLE99_02905 [Candidatus Saccharimonadales bacterium]|nr:hypothetical protein [Candidatus Saccharimonadales bacterium]
MYKKTFWQRLSLLVTSVSITSLGLAGAASASSISHTGPHSQNHISTWTKNTTTVRNTNTVSFANTNYQTAVSGNAIVSGNTYGGNATSGNAGNWNSTEFSVYIRN